jgi:hypothetical protein
MEASLDPELLNKIEIIAQGPNADLLRRLVNVLYNQEEEYFSLDDLAEIEAAEEAIRTGDRSQFVSWDDYKQRRGL